MIVIVFSWGVVSWVRRCVTPLCPGSMMREVCPGGTHTICAVCSSLSLNKCVRRNNFFANAAARARRCNTWCKSMIHLHRLEPMYAYFGSRTHGAISLQRYLLTTRTSVRGAACVQGGDQAGMLLSHSCPCRRIT